MVSQPKLVLQSARLAGIKIGFSKSQMTEDDESTVDQSEEERRMTQRELRERLRGLEDGPDLVKSLMELVFNDSGNLNVFKEYLRERKCEDILNCWVAIFNIARARGGMEEGVMKREDFAERFLGKVEFSQELTTMLNSKEEDKEWLEKCDKEISSLLHGLLLSFKHAF